MFFVGRTTDLFEYNSSRSKLITAGAESKGATAIISSQTPDNPCGNSATIVNNPTWVSGLENAP